jgi:hypothetical protein
LTIRARLSGSSNLAELQAQVDAQELAIAQLTGKVSGLEFDLEVRSDKTASVQLDAGYGAAQAPFGLILVSWEGIKPQGNGAQVELNFGNTTTATISNIDFVVDWRPDIKTPAAERKKLGGRVELSKPFNLQPGKWNRVTVQLPGAQADKVAYLHIGITNGVVSLYK